MHALTLPGDAVVDGVRTHVGDIADVEGTRALLLDLAPDEVYNLAAVSSVARSWAEPDLTVRVNGTAAAGLLESALQVQQRTGRRVRFVQASSAEIFGLPDRSPQDEETPLRPVNPYGAAKAFAHLMVDVYRGQGLHAVSLVLYNHESPRRPEQFVTRKITAGVAAIVSGAADRLTLGNLAATRDWGWAPDYVAAMVLAARAEVPRDYVVATGESHSVEEFVADGVPLRRGRRLVVVRRGGPGPAPAGRRDRAAGRRDPDPHRPRLGADGRLRGRRAGWSRPTWPGSPPSRDSP